MLRVSSDSWLGVHGDDTSTLWVGGEGPTRVVDADCAVGGLPLLERPRSEVVDELARASVEHGAPVAALLTRVVPTGLVKAALLLDGDYWLALTLPWLQDLETSSSTWAWAIRIEAAGGASQSTRHAARRLARRSSHDPRRPPPAEHPR